MRRTILAVVASTVGVGCPAGALAKPVTYHVPLIGAAEVLAPGDPDGSGTADLRFDPATARVCFAFATRDIAPVTIAHIHHGNAGTGGPPIIILRPSADRPADPCVAVAPDLVGRILANPANYYVNVHTAEFPMGALRGQLPGMNVVAAQSDEPVVIWSGKWQLKGNLLSVAGAGQHPAVLLLNKANGDRAAYEGLAADLARRGISSLRLDLRAHGESINLGKFVPGGPDAANILEGTWEDVAAALNFLRNHPFIDSGRIAVVGASYSGEAMAEAARKSGRYAQAYVALSPGSFSQESAASVDKSKASWLMVRSERERSPSVKAAAALLKSRSKTGRLWVLDASSHASDSLIEVPDLSPRLADWIAGALRRRR